MNIISPVGVTPVLPNTKYELTGATCEVNAVSEDITLAGTSVSTSASFLPATSLIEAVTWRWLTPIGGTAVSFTLGVSGTAAKFQASSTSVAKGDSGVGLAQHGTAGNVVNTTAAALLLTANAAATGTLRVTVFYRKFTAPT